DRPAILLSVLAPVTAEPALAETLLRETSTLGLRVRRVGRYEAERKEVEFSSSLGKVMVKLKLLSGVPISLSPEYEDCRCLAREHHLPLPEVLRIVSAEASAQLLPRREP
ncbi:MAG: DUF111 family protein, partial [Chloroflexota bacterium]|nr:DUF111 family protein [Chloroflexota bacterium]